MLHKYIDRLYLTPCYTYLCLPVGYLIPSLLQIWHTPIPLFTTTPTTACTCAQLLPTHNTDLLEGFYIIIVWSYHFNLIQYCFSIFEKAFLWVIHIWTYISINLCKAEISSIPLPTCKIISFLYYMYTTWWWVLLTFIFQTFKWLKHVVAVYNCYIKVVHWQIMSYYVF
jgi:hypothetical protein